MFTNGYSSKYDSRTVGKCILSLQTLLFYKCLPWTYRPIQTICWFYQARFPSHFEDFPCPFEHCPLGLGAYSFSLHVAESQFPLFPCRFRLARLVAETTELKLKSPVRAKNESRTDSGTIKSGHTSKTSMGKNKKKLIFCEKHCGQRVKVINGEVWFPAWYNIKTST